MLRDSPASLVDEDQAEGWVHPYVARTQDLARTQEDGPVVGGGGPRLVAKGDSLTLI
jgi:hypothetical protein